MFAGKTTALLEAVAAAERARQRVVVITHALDNRYGESKCATHSGMARPATAVQSLMSLVSTSENTSCGDLTSVDVIAVDEGQFYSDLTEFCHHAVETLRKTVIVAGLSGDYQRKRFGDLVSLVPLADHVEFLKARCTFCEQPAAFTLRLLANGQQTLVGGEDTYQPVCRQHYENLSKVGEEFVP